MNSVRDSGEKDGRGPGTDTGAVKEREAVRKDIQDPRDMGNRDSNSSSSSSQPSSMSLSFFCSNIYVNAL